MCITHQLQDKEVAVVVSFLEIYCDRVRDLGEAYMSQGERAVHGLKTTSDVYQKMKLVRCLTLRRKVLSDNKTHAPLHCLCASKGSEVLYEIAFRHLEEVRVSNFVGVCISYIVSFLRVPDSVVCFRSHSNPAPVDLVLGVVAAPIRSVVISPGGCVGVNCCA